LGKSGNATPLDKTKQRWLVYWHTLEEWGDIIYNWAQENGFVGSVCTLFELTQGEDTSDQGNLQSILFIIAFIIK
jgi:ESCRT-II complex subunit VPS25